MKNHKAIIIHGGAGKWPKDRVKKALNILKKAAKKGYEKIEENPVEAAKISINVLEDSEIFNAGRGSALNLLGEVETDASIMTGEKKCGAVAAVKNVKYTVNLAEIVINKTPHILLTGATAERLASKYGLLVDNETLITEDKYEMWKKSVMYILKGMGRYQGAIVEDELFQYLKSRFEIVAEFLTENEYLIDEIKKRLNIQNDVSDTVGVVVFSEGKIVAATSTGGTFLKLPGRIGDTPIIGAGTYADKNCGGVSATGLGESIIRTTLSYKTTESICKYGIEKGLIQVFNESWPKPSAGVIVIDKNGEWGAAHTTEHMPVAVITDNEEAVDYIWKKV